MENFNKIIAERIKNMRKERGYTIRDLSIKTDIAEASLSGYEHGKKGVGLKSLVSIADALNVSLDYLMGRSDEPFVKRSASPSFSRTQSDEELRRERFLADIGEVYDKYMESGQGTVDNESPEKARTDAINTLKNAIKAGEWKEPLWNCIKLHQGVEFHTAGRGKMHSGSTAFKYVLKRSSRTGEETSELIISTREAGKTITRSSVELALSRFLSIQQDAGFVKGPKAAGQIFGGSYLYAVFVAWGVISSSPDVSVDI